MLRGLLWCVHDGVIRGWLSGAGGVVVSLHDLLAMINQAKQDLVALDARIAARGGEVEEMTARFQALGLDGTAERLHAAQRELDEARDVRSQMAASLEEASRLAVMAIGGTGGVAMRGATEEAADFEPATPTPPGEEIVQSSRESGRRRGVRNLLDKTADVADSMKEFAGTADRIISVKDNGKDFFTPTHNTSTSATTPSHTPTISAQPPPQAGLMEGAMVLYVGAVTVTQSVMWVNDKLKRKREG